MNNQVVKLTLFLLLITGISGLAIGYVNGITAPVIAAQDAEKLLQGYSEVYPDADTYDGEAVESLDNLIDSVVLAKKDGNTAGVIYTVPTQGYGGEIRMLIGMDIAGKKITGIKILSQTETPGLGGNCTQPWFALRYAGKTAARALRVVKTEPIADDEVQAITAATITSTAVAAGVNAAIADFGFRFSGE
ncbi:MAG: FMN-binding protein [Clostridiales bacterium]|nr:FMN-binding protein [Clostridiales bacterium]